MNKKILYISALYLIFPLMNSTVFALTNTGNHESVISDVNNYSNYNSQYLEREYNAKSAAEIFVKTAQLHKSLSLLLLESVKGDEIIENAIKLYGFSTVKKSVVAKIKNITSEYRTQWDDLLIDIYSHQFDAKTLRSISDKGENSPYFTKFVSKQKNTQTNKLLLVSPTFKEARTNLMNTLKNNFSL